MATTTVTVVSDSGDIWPAGTYANIDEGIASFNDSDLIRTSNSADRANFNLGPTPADFGTLTAIEIQVRARHTQLKSTPLEMDYVQVVEQNGSTAISAQATYTETTSFATYILNPAVTGATSKAALDVAKLKFLTNSESGGNVEVSCVDVIYTYTPSASFVPFPYRGLSGGFNWLKGGTQ